MQPRPDGRLLLLLLLLPLAALPDTQSLGSEERAPMGSRGPVVVIVGAGISGIAAAEKLHQSGFQNVKILEATGRTGGRIRTQSFAKGLVEIGAQWIHGPSPGNPIFQLASQFGLLRPDALLEENQKRYLHEYPSSTPVVYSSSGGQISPAELKNIRELYGTWMEESRNFTNGGCDPEDSIGNFIRQKIVNSSQEWKKELAETNMAYLRSMLNLECCISAAHSMDNVALCPSGEYTILPGLDCTFPNTSCALGSRYCSADDLFTKIGATGLLEQKFTPSPGRSGDHYWELDNRIRESRGHRNNGKHAQICRSEPSKRNWEKGFESIVNRIKAPLPDGTVLLNKAVKGIHWDGSFHGDNSQVYPVKVQCEDGDSFVADHVIVTVPLGFLKKRLVDFLIPPLPPSKTQAIRNLGFGTNNKILVEFEKPFWDPNTTLIQPVWEGGSPFTEPNKDLRLSWMKKLAIFVVLEPPAQLGHVLCGFIAGEESEFMETLTDEEIFSSMTEYFRTFTGNPELPPPISILRSQWHSHPYTGGSYSYVAVGSSGIDVDNLAEPLPTGKEAVKPLQVLFAGEATIRNFYSTTHGALVSGWREAQRLIDKYPEIGATNTKAKL